MHSNLQRQRKPEKVTEVDIIAACNQVQAAVFVYMGKWDAAFPDDGDVENLIELESVSDHLRKMVIKFVKQERE